MYIKETIIRDDLIDGFAIQVFFLIYVWLHWIFIAVHRLTPVVVSRATLYSACLSFSL